MDFKYKLETKYSGTIDVALVYEGDYNNGGKCITVYSKDKEYGYAEPWCDFTRWVTPVSEDEVAIDVNNSPDILQWAIDNNIIEPPHRYAQSGFVRYPICKLKIQLDV